MVRLAHCMGQCLTVDLILITRFMQVHLEGGKGLAIEIARYIQNDAFFDNVWDAYHGIIILPSTQLLLEEGCLDLILSDPLAFLPWISVKEDPDLSVVLGSGCLPAYTPGPSKGKPLEADLAAGASVWQQCGAALSCASLKLSSPVVPVWHAPEEPAKKVPDLIPTRDLHPAPPPSTPADDFKAQIDKAIQMLAAAFKDHYTVSDQEDSSLTVPQRHKRLIFQLNRSGEYEGLRDSLKAALVRVVKEELGGSGNMSPEEMGPMYSQLYNRLMDLTHIRLAR